MPRATASDSGRYGAARPSRVAWSLAIAVHLLVALLFVFHKREPIVKMAERGLTTFNIAPEGPKGSETEKTETKQEETQAKQAASQALPVPAETPPELPPPPVVRDFQPNFLVLSSADYAASNIANRASERQAQAAAGRGDSRAPTGPGAGPGGATLYPADWYREPTSTEINGYLSPGQPSAGWGEIACKTVARYRVEDCITLAESPRGSGFARSVLNASWQFLILPPRINGRSQVGTWVRIRITWGPEGNKAG